MSEAESRAARIISEHRLARRRLAALDPSVRPADEASAYASQDQLHAILSSAGFGPVVGPQDRLHHSRDAGVPAHSQPLRGRRVRKPGAPQPGRRPARGLGTPWSGMRDGGESQRGLGPEASAVYPRNRGCGSRRGDGRDGDRRRPLCRLQEPGYAHAHRRRLLRRRLRAGCAGCRLAFARSRVAHRCDADQRRRSQDVAAGRT